MSEWYDNQKKPSNNFRKLLQERIAKANPRRTLTAEEHRRLSKIEAIAAKLKRRKKCRVIDDLHTCYTRSIRWL